MYNQCIWSKNINSHLMISNYHIRRQLEFEIHFSGDLLLWMTTRRTRDWHAIAIWRAHEYMIMLKQNNDWESDAIAVLCVNVWASNRTKSEKVIRSQYDIHANAWLSNPLSIGVGRWIMSRYQKYGRLDLELRNIN